MIAPGTRLGSYRVDYLVGEGGMGQVYRAIDTRLDRVVAIKVLPEHLSSQAALKERFEREARAISALSHPNICALFDVGSDGGTEFLVMEYVEGETLADRLARGPLPLDQVIRYGAEIAEALAAAHRRGIVHRDLKPGNVMITKSGAKLLDFGLARSVPSVLAAPDAPTEQHAPLTAEGTILGTFQYMAPEQVEGREADARTDVFALGAVLYEMVTGRRAFDGKSKASLIASILDREPPPIPSTGETRPAALERLIRACLAKDPDDRLQSARDVAVALRWIGESSVERPARSRAPWIGVAVLALLMLLAFGAWRLTSRASRSAGEAPSVHLAILPPPGFRFVTANVSQQGVIAFFADKGNERHLFTRPLDSDQVRDLGAIQASSSLNWSPDGKWIAYFSGRRLMKIAATGGTPQVITEASYGFGAAWGEDGNIVFTPSFFNPLFVVSADGGTPRQLTKLDTTKHEAVHGWPTLLPDDGGILYLSVTLPGEMNRIFHLPADGEAKPVVAADAMVGFSDPYLLYVRGGEMFAVRFDADGSRMVGAPRRIAEGVSFNLNDSTARSAVTPEGVLVYPPRVSEKRRLAWYDRSGKNRRTVVEDDDIANVSISPDGRRLLLTRFMPESGVPGIYRVDLDRGTQTLLTPPPRFGFNAVWLRDGERFVYTSARRSADFDLFTQFDDAQSQATPFWEARSDDKEALTATRDGRAVVVREYLTDTTYDLWLVPLDPQSPRTRLVTGPSHDAWGELSPDGRWLAYVSNLSGRDEVYVRRVEGGRTVQVSTNGGGVARWSPDGSEILFITPGKMMMRTSFESRSNTPVLGMPEALFQLDANVDDRWDLSPDGQHFLINELRDSASSIEPYYVVTGWKEALEK